MRWLLDSDCCIAALRRRPTALQWLRQVAPGDCAISAISEFELHRGAALSDHLVAETERVRAFLKPLAIVAFTGSAVSEAAHLSGRLARLGHPIGPYDTLIAGHALALGLVLVTANQREFSRIPGLKLKDWSRS
jgi:tRNA(fMet)-specific endonuclease VapC